MPLQIEKPVKLTEGSGISQDTTFQGHLCHQVTTQGKAPHLLPHPIDTQTRSISAVLQPLFTIKISGRWRVCVSYTLGCS